MMKSVKGKIVTGVVTLGLLSGVGAAFANTDAGTQLKNWYKGQFNQSVGTVASNSAGYAASKAPALVNEYNAIKTGTGSDINEARTLKTTEASNAINNAANSHINALNNQKAAIKGYMAGQFDSIVVLAKGVINEAGNVGYQYASNDLGKYTSQKGTKALDDMNTELTATKDQAVKDLQDAITAAKDELQSQLNTETSTATAEIKAAIDAKIVELRGLITQKAEDLLATQKQLIADKANELEGNAKDELQKVVDGI